MKVSAASIRLSASDLSNHLACHHLTGLDRAVAVGERPAPSWHSPDAWVLQQLGLAHERAYVETLESQGLSIVNLRDLVNEETALAETAAAMERGADAIIQAAVGDSIWF